MALSGPAQAVDWSFKAHPQPHHPLTDDDVALRGCIENKQLQELWDNCRHIEEIDRVLYCGRYTHDTGTADDALMRRIIRKLWTFVGYRSVVTMGDFMQLNKGAKAVSLNPNVEYFLWKYYRTIYLNKYGTARCYASEKRR